MGFSPSLSPAVCQYLQLALLVIDMTCFAAEFNGLNY
jgi:hypothetical protein